MANIVEQVRTDLPNISGPLPGPRAAAMIARDTQVVSPSYTRSYPLVAAQGSGAIIEDVDGNRFLDFNAGIAVVATGHCHPEVVRAIQEQEFGKLFADLAARVGARRHPRSGQPASGSCPALPIE
jgi:4-aminobutyrate aminotransferase